MTPRHLLPLLAAWCLAATLASAQAASNLTQAVIDGGCLVSPSFCLNAALCGINGNCICPRHFYG